MAAGKTEPNIGVFRPVVHGRLNCPDAHDAAASLPGMRLDTYPKGARTTMSDSREENGSIGTSLITFLLGVAVGATVAILYAPAAGTETRQQIAEKAGQLKDK